jgi:ATP-binding protein involved in chromosome partitioning
VAVNLACALGQLGLSIGLLDADVYGPSIPRMLGLTDEPVSVGGKLLPLQAFGIKAMSIGLLVDEAAPMIWRGPMASSALNQMLNDVNWGSVEAPLDVLVIDMPPGTGDIQLTLSQRVPLTGAVIVTTPQDIALIDAMKGIRMFQKVGVPILGIVENMAVHVCSQCGHAEHIFGVEGGKKMAQAEGMTYLGALPLSMAIRVQADSGLPSVVAEPDGEVAGIYKAVARQLAVKVAARAKDFSSKFPTIKVSKDT